MTTEEQAALALLERGLEARATAPLLLRLMGKRTIGVRVHSPTLGNIYRISALIARYGLTADKLEGLENETVPALYLKYAKPASRILAYGCMPGVVSGFLLNRLAAWWLRWHLKPIQLMTMVRIMVMLTQGENFINIIKSIGSLMMTSGLSQNKKQGS